MRLVQDVTTDLSLANSSLKSPLTRLKVYPRLRLHISFADLAASLYSFLYFPNREQLIRDIQLDWQGNREGLEPQYNNVKKLLPKPGFKSGWDKPIDDCSEVLVTLSVRTALDLLLQSLKLPAGSEVLMSAVNIRDMVEVVKRHGLVPIPVDISLDTLAPDLKLLESLISEKSKVLIVAHLFGSIINLKPYTKLCKKYQIFLVEDCAQAFAGDKYHGSKDADVSLFSFGPIKSCTALGGAIAVIRERSLAQQMRDIDRQYPCKSESWFFKRILKYFCLKLFSIPWLYYHLLVFLKYLGKNLDSVINSMTRGFSQGDILAKIRYRPPTQMLVLLRRRLRNCNPQWFERRSKNARKFLSLLKPEITCPGSKTEYNSFWVVPILVSNPPSVMAKLREYGFDATQGNTSLTFIDNASSGDKPTKGSVNAQRLIQYVLYLPVSESLPENDLVCLAQLINEFHEACPMTAKMPDD
ncbi:aminotransferase class I/II-fold pyridoxal phosphate-dependent enzyme [Coleofasciculus sp. H7-2]|uniref:aminotransferase class I/II-fold pyridoxal phosphate-dependent enzyme n=1 Tax=Coleofasciculus sp. H7-2 TaxID=3351545 RepID=UPI00366B942F